MKFKLFSAAMIAATLLIALTACGKTQSPTPSETLSSTVQQTEQNTGSKASASENSPSHENEAWKEKFEKSLFENYGVIPKYYEDLGNGIYQVYAEVGGTVVPFVTVDSATGDYHG